MQAPQATFRIELDALASEIDRQIEIRAALKVGIFLAAVGGISWGFLAGHALGVMSVIG